MARKSRKNSEKDDIYIKIYKTAIYARLSREAQKIETIENQIEYVKSYIEKRPHFQLVDFIAINDDYDNINIKPEEYFLASFKNLAHSHFASETSRKVAMAKRSLQEQGKFIGNRAKFGYSIDPNDCHKLIINEEQAAVIREIFTRAADGERISSIHKDITSRENAVFKSNVQFVFRILRDEIYIGTLIQRTTMTSFYKNEEMQKVPKSEQLRFENAVPAIISMELWNKARQVIEERKANRKRKAPQGSDEP